MCGFGGSEAGGWSVYLELGPVLHSLDSTFLSGDKIFLVHLLNHYVEGCIAIIQSFSPGILPHLKKAPE